MICPLCGTKVVYEGFASLECGSSATCPNYKEQPKAKNSLKFDTESFDDTLIDWNWFVPFCGWVSERTGIYVTAAMDGELCHVHIPSEPRRSWSFASECTRRDIRRMLAKAPCFAWLRERGL